MKPQREYGFKTSNANIKDKEILEIGKWHLENTERKCHHFYPAKKTSCKYFLFNYSLLSILFCSSLSVSIVVRQPYTLQSVSPDISSLHLTPHTVITISLAHVPALHFTSPGLFCNYQFVLPFKREKVKRIYHPQITKNKTRRYNKVMKN